jgi:hypothetical protein
MKYILSPLLACGEGVGGGVLVPHNIGKCCISKELLYNLQKNLKINQSSQTEDQELIMRLAPLYQKDRELAKQEGLQEGLQKEKRLIIRQLNRRIGEIDSLLIQKVQS